MILYEGLYQGLTFLWDGLRFEVATMGKDYHANLAKEAQQGEIEEHSINRVPQDDEEEAPAPSPSATPRPTPRPRPSPTPRPNPRDFDTNDDGATAEVEDEGSSEDM
jgi:hypothetical protein